MILRRVFILILIVASCSFGGVIASPREDAIKSGFLYNFARYSQGEWFTPELKSNYTICSFSKKFTDIANQTLKKFTIQNLPVVVQHISSKLEKIAECDTLFVSKEDTDKWYYFNERQILTHAMLVGEFDGFLDSGGHINFYIVGGKIRFEANPEELKAAGINMSSKVLRLGLIYEGKQQ